MPSFDVVSRTDIQELDNALNGVGRETKQRYDLKGTMCSIERSGDNVTITADNELLLRQMHELLQVYCARRGVNSSSLNFKNAQAATRGSVRQEATIRQGIDETTGKQIVKMIKGTKVKVQVSIQGEELRISGKKRDDLQQTIEILKDMKLDMPLQYINFRD
jgi:uncharacterized protein YajQ (UPF0234 family)